VFQAKPSSCKALVWLQLSAEIKMSVKWRYKDYVFYQIHVNKEDWAWYKYITFYFKWLKLGWKIKQSQKQKLK